MTSNSIRFRVHSRRNVVNNILDQAYDISEVLLTDVSDNQIDILLSMLSATNSMINNSQIYDDNLENIDPIELAVRNSMEGQELKRCEETIIDVNSISYENTEKTFNSCSICSDDYKNTETVSVLNCSHVFHKDCIIEWGHYHPSCPVCKKGIPTI